jgi:O-antigen/teichoic acid export membrane protein
MRYFLTPSFLVLLLNRSLPREQVAIFALGIDLIFKVAATASSGAQGWVVPLLASAHDGREPARMQLAYAGTVQLLSTLLLPAGFLFLAMTGALIPLLYGEAFSGASRIVWLLGPCLLLEFSISAPAAAACYAVERLTVFVATGAAMASLSIVSGLCGSWLGLELVCALLGLIRLAGASALNLHVVRSQQLSFPMAFVAKLLAVSGLVAWLLPRCPAEWLCVMTHTAAGGLALLVGVKLVGPLKAEDRLMMQNCGLRGARLITKFL